MTLPLSYSRELLSSAALRTLTITIRNAKKPSSTRVTVRRLLFSIVNHATAATTASVAIAKIVFLSNALATNQNLELMTGIEPVTSPLPRECSTN